MNDGLRVLLVLFGVVVGFWLGATVESGSFDSRCAGVEVTQ